MNDGIISLLKIPGFFVTDVQIRGEEIVISARKRSKTARCPTCRKRSKRLKDYLRERRVLHMILSRQKIYLVFRKRRFVCIFCGKAFTEVFSFLPKRSNESIFVKEEALEKLSDSSFKKTTERLGFSYGKLVTLLKKVFSLSAIDWQGQLVNGILRLGIDEHHFGRKNQYLVTIANLLTRKPIHILTKCTKQAVKEFLLSLPQETKKSIDEVAVDMRDAFIAAVREALPNARIVIDHFHVIQDANKRVSEARKIEEDVEEKVKGNGPKRIPFKLFTKNREDLKGDQPKLMSYYQHKYPTLALFYSCKERLRIMYKAGTKEEAEELLTGLIAEMKRSEYPDLWLWAKTLTKYQPYILNYFDNHTTNAVTEGLHRKFKLIQRQAFGFRNPEVYAYRIMLGCLPLTVFLSKLYPTT
jgi:transposase